MNYAFAERVQNLKPSAIREILKYSSDPAVIPFSAGNPAPEAFPVEAVQEITARILSEHPIDALQYSLTEGYPALRERLSAYMKEKHNVGREGDVLLVTSGAQQVMGLAVKALCNKGDVVLCEAPSFIGSLNAFRSMNARLVGVPMESDGMDINALEDALKTNENVKFIYTIPNFQNPSGITMSLEKRQAMLALAKKYQVLILEDNPYGDLRFEGAYIPSIKSMDEDGLVLYAGSFSKVLSPGLRVGYAIGPAPVVQKMIVCKQGEDVHTGILSQMICERFMAAYDYEAHLKALQDLYRERARAMCRYIDEYLAPAGVTYQPVTGGLFVWCTLPERISMPEFCTRAVKERKVAVVPGSAFLVDEGLPCSSFRVNFSTPTVEAMERGCVQLGELAREYRN